jgi:hypothetical protein
VTNDVYQQYIANLRSVGCPEKQIRNIVIADANELFDKRRLEFAIKTDAQWWKADTFMGVLPMQGAAGVNFDEERREILEKLIGSKWDDGIRLPSLNGSAVNLTGPVLGALPTETYNTVQEVCAKSMDRHQSYMMTRMNEGGAMDPIEMAKLRDFTRTELAKILTPEELEEFLLRYSHNSSKLRQDTRGLDLTPDEFRKIFRAIDPVEHKVQLEYGGPEVLSQKAARPARIATRPLRSRKRFPLIDSSNTSLRKIRSIARRKRRRCKYGMNSKGRAAAVSVAKSARGESECRLRRTSALTPEQKAQALQSISTRAANRHCNGCWVIRRIGSEAGARTVTSACSRNQIVVISAVA